MPQGFHAIPNWFAHNNQGAGVAVVERGGGVRDVAVLMVDNPVQKNRGLYRLGKDAGSDGAPRQGWTAWLDVPDWFSWENEGAGLASADIDGDGRPDLVVFMIDAPNGKNQGYYRVGHGLDADGQITGGWSPWIAIPDWFAWSNQHGGIALAKVAGGARHDLVVLMVDAPDGKNQGYFRIGRDLAPDGNVTGGWSPWQAVPDWFSWENQGADIAVADIDHSGLLDLIVFQIDGAVTQNQAFYKLGRNLTGDGAVGGGWSTWLGVPDWFSWENEGGGIAAADLKGNGAPQLLLTMVDAPPGQNEGLFRVLDIAPDPATQGRWETLPYFSEVLAVHGAVLPHGKVLFFAGSGSSKVRFQSPDFGSMTKKIWCSVAWDWTQPPTAAGAGSFFHPVTLRYPDNKVFDLFCGGGTFLPDGKLLSAGGTHGYPGGGAGFVGTNDAALYDPVSQSWSFTGSMNAGRWYPSLIVLGDGRVLAASGLGEHGAHNTELELYAPVTGQWSALPTPSAHAFPGLPLYPHLFLMADGRLFFNGGRMDDPSDVGPQLIDLTKSPVTYTPVPGLPQPQSRNQAASVLLPPAQDQRVMIIGGGPEDETNATDAVDICDLKAAHPAFVPAEPLNLPRMHLNAVLLPDRTVFVSGGSLQRESENVARRQAEIYDPEMDTWTIAATATISRRYHSIAVLLPDGRVVAAGGNPHGGHQVPWLPPDPDEEMRLEVYSPPYLFRGVRPAIANAPEEWTYGASIGIQTPDAGQIRWAELIRPCVTTHAFDSSQRLVDLPITSRGGGTVQVTVPAQRNLAPPGWYMLFLVDNARVPSVARWVHLG